MKKKLCFLLVFVILIGKVNAVSAQGYAVYDVLKKEFIAQSNGDSHMLFASTTKIMTALVALELYDIDEMVSIKREWTNIEGSSMYLVPNEVISIRALLYGLMLNSGNDAAVALASIYSGNISDFVTLMNAKAIEIGAEHTFFENPNGLDGKNHKTTAKDLALIAARALENEEFCKIAATKSIEIGERYFGNHNKLLSMDKEIIGVKTGFTKAAGRCLVSASDKGGRRYVVVTLNAPDDWNDHLYFHRELAKEGKMTEVIQEDFSVELPVVGEVLKTVTVKAEQAVALPVTKDEKIKISVCGSRFVYGSAKEGERYGEIQIFLDDKYVKSVDLIYTQTVETQETKRNFIENIWEILKNYRK